MFQLIHFILSVILLSFAVSVIYPHVRTVWLNHSQGWWRAIAMEWKIAKPPLLVAILIVLAVIAIEIVVWRVDNKETAEFRMQLMESDNRIEMKLDEINESINNLIDEIRVDRETNSGE